MMPIIPAMGVMIIAMIIMGLVTTRQRKGHHKGEKPDAEEVFYFVIHDGWFTPGSSKTLPEAVTAKYVNYCRYFSPNTLKMPPKWYSLRRKAVVFLFSVADLY
jgi:hypothetical protein